jgi:hypothetical protein
MFHGAVTERRKQYSRLVPTLPLYKKRKIITDLSFSSRRQVKFLGWIGASGNKINVKYIKGMQKLKGLPEAK